MKRYIRSSEEYTSDEKQQILQALKDKGIDTTKHRYIVKWREYEGMDAGDHSNKITAPGNYLAMFALVIRKSVTWSSLKFQWDLEDILWYIDKYPSIDALKKGPAAEWACPDEYRATFYLENVDTGEILWDEDYEDLYYEDDEDDDW